MRVSFVCGALLVGAASARAQSQPTEFERGWASGVPATVTGELTALVADDFEHGRAEVKYYVRDSKTGRPFWVHFDDEASTHRSDSVVTLSGRATISDLYVLAASTDLSAPSFGTRAEMPSTPVVAGDQKTLVVIANFTNAAVSCQPSAINDAMFADPAGISVDALYREMSFGNVSFSGTTVGPFTIPFASSSTCDPGAWASAADAQAAASGVDVAAYPRRLYVMPSNSCGATGYGTMSSVPSSAWVFACDLKGAYAHEVGHNLGMNHGSTPDMEYGDITDAMTSATTRLRPTNAPHRHQMGWLPGSAIRLATEGGVYYVAPLESNPVLAPSPQVLAVAKPDTGEYYYFSYRHALGFDNYISANYLDTLSVHRYKGDGSASRTYLLAGLANGESFVDDVNGIRVTMVGHDDTRATVELQLTPTCIAALPSIAVPASLQGGAAGSAVTFTGTVTNRDSSVCAPTAFSLGTSVPNGWTTSTSPAVVSLAPGQISDFTVTVASSASAAAGTYALTVRAADGAAISHQANASVSYSLTSLCLAKPPVLTVSPTAQRGAPGTTVTYGFGLTNTDGDGCGSTSFIVTPNVPAGWSTSSSQLAVTLKPGATSSFNIAVTSPLTSAFGTFSIPVSALDASATSHGTAVTATYTVADTSSPTAPVGLTAAMEQKSKQIQLAWSTSADNVAVAGYRISRNGVVAGTSSTTSWTDTTWVAGSTYTYSVVAYDAAGNVSLPSNAVSVTLAGSSKKK